MKNKSDATCLYRLPYALLSCFNRWREEGANFTRQINLTRLSAQPAGRIDWHPTKAFRPKIWAVFSSMLPLRSTLLWCTTNDTQMGLPGILETKEIFSRCKLLLNNRPLDFRNELRNLRVLFAEEHHVEAHENSIRHDSRAQESLELKKIRLWYDVPPI